MSLAGIILAAGVSRRMGRVKALLEYEGETFLDRLVGILAADCDPVIVVLGHHAARIEAGFERRAQALVVHNPDPDRGQLSSLACGLRAVPAGSEGVLFTPVDYPAVRPATVALLLESFRAGGPAASVAIPVFDGRRGHPVCISGAVAAELLDLPPDSEARAVIRRHQADTCLVDVDDPGVVEDVDDPEAYRRLLERARP